MVYIPFLVIFLTIFIFLNKVLSNLFNFGILFHLAITSFVTFILCCIAILIFRKLKGYLGFKKAKKIRNRIMKITYILAILELIIGAISALIHLGPLALLALIAIAALALIILFYGFIFSQIFMLSYRFLQFFGNKELRGAETEEIRREKAELYAKNKKIIESKTLLYIPIFAAYLIIFILLIKAFNLNVAIYTYRDSLAYSVVISFIFFAIFQSIFKRQGSKLKEDKIISYRFKFIKLQYALQIIGCILYFYLRNSNVSDLVLDRLIILTFVSISGFESVMFAYKVAIKYRDRQKNDSRD